jgi:RimJ/RimL family protein N-acetyltransferase
LIHAYIKADNLPSIAAFKRAGFVSAPFDSKDGRLHFVFEKRQS